MHPHILNFIIWTQEDVFTDSSFTLGFYHADAYTKPTQSLRRAFKMNFPQENKFESLPIMQF